MLFDFEEKDEGLVSFNGEAGQVPSIGNVRFETILGEKNTITGNIEGSSPVLINGKLKGNINSTSYVYISQTGHIDGDVVADQMVLIGSLTGTKVEVDKLQVTSTGVLNADAKVARLTVDEGGVLNGQIVVIPTARKNETPSYTDTTFAEEPEE